MCGLAGYMHLDRERPVEAAVLSRMADRVHHRGPDSAGYFASGAVGFAFRRLSIVDLEHGHQPIYSEDRSVVLLCNGEIFNAPELRHELESKGHRFASHSDVEVVVHLYEEVGVGCVERLRGQFAFAIYDDRCHRLFLARDHVGILPMHFSVAGNTLVFASEIKALLEYPGVARGVDLCGLDQILTFPGLVSPRTVFRGVRSLPPGHRLVAEDGAIRVTEYWDLIYPERGEIGEANEGRVVAEMSAALAQAVARRLQADVPVGCYVSGGLDSSLIAAYLRTECPDRPFPSFSVAFRDAHLAETRYQRLMTGAVASEPHSIPFGVDEVRRLLGRAVYHAECPFKESYNTASLALSAAAREAGVPVILSGEGADEIFGGYIGYRFDSLGAHAKPAEVSPVETEMRRRLWGDDACGYERRYAEVREATCRLYAPRVRDAFASFDCLQHAVVNPDRIRGRHPFHQRSYLDFKLRLADHLLADHGDRMAMANSVEMRFPFLDLDVLELARELPPALHVKDLTEKYILKRVADGRVPAAIVRREKFAFQAPGSPALLLQSDDQLDELLGRDRLLRDGYFDPEAVAALRRDYQSGRPPNLPYEDDMLMIVITFNLLLDLFDLPGL